MQRWHQHFSKLLNQESTFKDEVIEQIPMQLPCPEFDEPPTEEELEGALSKMKKHKAGDKTEILPELVLFGGATLLDRLLELIQLIWKEGEVVADWKNTEVVPIPKKGTSNVVITGVASVCWMWWERYLLESFRRGYK